MEPLLLVAQTVIHRNNRHEGLWQTDCPTHSHGSMNMSALTDLEKDEKGGAGLADEPTRIYTQDLR
jgi:hypothetical protein